jgi:hypothetical protein
VEFREYSAGRDKDAVHRIWLETGWVEKDNQLQRESVDIFARSGRSLVAEINGEAECFVRNCPGSMRYLSEELPFTGVCAVTTSRLVRKQGIAAKLTAKALALDAADGALVSGLGMFEQGYYNRLGYATGSYEHWVSFDPARLRVDAAPRVPRRIILDDWKLVHRSRLARKRGHGGCNFIPPEETRAEMMWTKNGFGLGYADDAGELTHHLWCDAGAGGEHGPYSVYWMAYRTREQFTELMALLKSLGDQVLSVRMHEPPGLQMQDLISQPFKQYDLTEKGKYEARASAYAYWQMRICDLSGCIERTRLPLGEARFNLKLTDPIGGLLEADTPWRGCAGDYVVTLGKSSGAEAGRDDSLPTMSASVNAFTRLWLGVRPASSLRYTDDLDAPPELIETLDSVLRLPPPHPDWEF